MKLINQNTFDNIFKILLLLLITYFLFVLTQIEIQIEKNSEVWTLSKNL